MFTPRGSQAEWHRVGLVLGDMSGDRPDSLTRAAARQGLTPEFVREYAGEYLEKRKGRWVIAEDHREWSEWVIHALAQMRVITLDGLREIFISDEEKRLEYARYLQCVKEALRPANFFEVEETHNDYVEIIQVQDPSDVQKDFEVMLRLHSFTGRTFSDDDGVEYWYVTDVDLLREIYDYYWRDDWYHDVDPANEINEPDWD